MEKKVIYVSAKKTTQVVINLVYLSFTKPISKTVHKFKIQEDELVSAAPKTNCKVRIPVSKCMCSLCLKTSPTSVQYNIKIITEVLNKWANKTYQKMPKIRNPHEMQPKEHALQHRGLKYPKSYKGNKSSNTTLS